MRINEDIRLFNLIAKCLAYGRKVGIVSDDDNIACLDLLMRKDTSWKPSEEQMEALNKARRFIPYNCDILESLYEQLKKL